MADFKGEQPKTKPHFHFCKKCHCRWKCEMKIRKECPLSDGTYCERHSAIFKLIEDVL